MAGIGVLVDDGLDPGYAYKLIVPPGARSGAVVDLSRQFDIATLPEVFSFDDNDFLIISRGGILYKVRFSALANPIINVEAGVVTHNNDTILYNGDTVVYNLDMATGDISYNGNIIVYNGDIVIYQ